MNPFLIALIQALIPLQTVLILGLALENELVPHSLNQRNLITHKTSAISAETLPEFEPKLALDHDIKDVHRIVNDLWSISVPGTVSWPEVQNLVYTIPVQY